MIVRGKLEIELDPAIIAGFDLPPEILDGNYLIATILTAEDYTPRRVSEQQTIPTFDGLYPINGPVQYSFDFVLKDPRVKIYKALELQAKQSNSTINPNSAIQFLTIRDYCNADPEDFLATTAGEQPFTTRRGNLYFNGDLRDSGSWFDPTTGVVERYNATSWTFHQVDLIR